MEEKYLLDLFFQRDERAIQTVRESYGAYCRTVVNGILNNEEDIEECLNDTWLRAWNAIPPQRPTNLRMYLAKIARNLALDRYKASCAEKRRQGTLEITMEELAFCVPAGETTESQVQAHELERLIGTFLRTLRPMECNVFLRRYFYAESVAEIAGRYRLSESYVRLLLSRTRNKLKKYLVKEAYW